MIGINISGPWLTETYNKPLEMIGKVGNVFEAVPCVEIKLSRTVGR